MIKSRQSLESKAHHRPFTVGLLQPPLKTCTSRLKNEYLEQCQIIIIKNQLENNNCIINNMSYNLTV